MSYEFGRFRLDPRARELTRNGEVIPLFPKVFDTLVVLVESAGEVLSKDELMRRVWPDTFVQESNLTQNIFILRKTLGEDEAQSWIETVPRRGYRFSAEVRSVDEVFVSRRTTIRVVTDDGHPSPGRTRFLAGILVGMAVLAGTGFTVRRLARSEGAAAVPVIPRKLPTLVRLTQDSRAYDPAISPDGKLLAYKVLEGDSVTVWLKDLVRGSSVRVLPPNKEDYRSLAFSLDGSELFYRTYPKGVTNGAIMRVPIFGGVPQEVARDIWTDFALSPDGRELAFVRGTARSEGVRVVAARTDGGGERTIGSSVYQRTWFHLWETAPAWSPDGKRLALCGGVHDGEGDRPALFEMDSDDGETRELAIPGSWASVTQVGWLGDGSGVVVAGSRQRSDPPQLWEITFPGGAVRRITNDVNEYRKVRLSRDARLLIAEQQVRNDHLWVVPKGIAARARQVTFGVGDGDGYSGVVWLGGDRILFTSDRAGTQQVWSMNADGTEARPLTASGEFSSTQLAVSPDGRFIVLVSDRAGRRNIWRLDAGGGNPLQLTSGDDEIAPSVSPDGRWVYYTDASVLPSRIERVPIDGGRALEVDLPGSVSSPRVSPDGRTIAFAHYDDEHGWRHAVAPLAGGEPRFFPWHSIRGTAVWTPDSTALWYISGANLWLQPVDGREARRVTAFDDGQIWNFAVAPNGVDVAVVRGHAFSDIVSIRDFR